MVGQIFILFFYFCDWKHINHHRWGWLSSVLYLYKNEAISFWLAILSWLFSFTSNEYKVWLRNRFSYNIVTCLSFIDQLYEVILTIAKLRWSSFSLKSIDTVPVVLSTDFFFRRKLTIYYLSHVVFIFHNNSPLFVHGIYRARLKIYFLKVIVNKKTFSYQLVFW